MTDLNFQWRKMTWLKTTGEAAKPMFLSLLGMARSVRNLRHLHDTILPANCRLLRDDLILLENFWQDNFSHLYSGQPQQINDDNAHWILSGLAPMNGLSTYYIKALERKRKNIANPDAEISSYATILSTARTPERDVHELPKTCYRHFVASLEWGQNLQLGFYVPHVSFPDEDSPWRDKIIVWFLCREYSMDEVMVHNILSKMPPYSLIDKGNSSSVWAEDGDEVYVSYAIGMGKEWGEIKKHIRWIDGKEMYVSKNSFYPFITQKLRTMNIPVLQIRPDEEWRTR